MLFVIGCVMLYGLFLCELFNVCVCESFLALNLVVWFGRDVLCDAVWCVVHVRVIVVCL